MWAISKVKEIGKGAFHRNYWKAVLIALVVTFGISGASSGTSVTSIKSKIQDTYNDIQDITNDDYTYGSNQNPFLDDDDYYFDGDYYLDDDYSYNHHSDFSNAEIAAIIGAVAIIFIVVLFVVMAIDIVLSIFLFNPLKVGGSKFYLKNLKEPAAVRELAWGFDNSYKNIIKIMFLRDLFTFLWTLLLIIPGIVKSYEYRMIPFLLSENPEMTQEEAFARSRYLMDGNKWRAFVFDLSFIGWYFLCIIPFVGMFYVKPYKNSADAALYDAIRITKGPGYQPQNFQQGGFQGQPQNFQQGGFQGQPQNFQQGGFQEQPQNFQQGGFQEQPQNFQQGGFQEQPQNTQQDESQSQPQADASQMFVDESTEDKTEI